ncbi:recombinase family protein [Pedobacter panaciterrae]
MQTAYLYIRVSTDEQAAKGYSLPFQEERLQTYCLLHNISILRTIREECSARTFDRPGWKKLMIDLNKYKKEHPDLLLFTRWDRFSRNAADAYYMIRLLGNLHVEPQATEQPLDLSVPENKILLAVYIVTSEVENDRRSLNVRQGIYKARKEGRWTSRAPLGYTYQLPSNKQKCIVRKEPEATFIKNAFTLITAKERKSIQFIYNKLVGEGFKCSRSNFWRIIKNPIYYGKVVVPPFEGARAYYVQGVHEAIIPDILFINAQNVLGHRKHRCLTISHPIEKLFLRGFIYCPLCGGRLTGSGSKGKLSRYYYYHCHHCSSFRVRADKIHQSFLLELSKLKADKFYQDLYRKILKHIRKDLFAEQSINQKTISQSTSRLIERILKAKELLQNGEIENEDFLVIKKECEQNINSMGIDLKHSILTSKNTKRRLNKAVQQLSQLEIFWRQSNFTTKRKFLSFLLKDQPILGVTLNFNAMINGAMQSIYNLGRADYKPKQEDEHLQSTMNTQFIKEMTALVLTRESRKNPKIQNVQAQEILTFLVNFAALTIENTNFPY